MTVVKDPVQAQILAEETLTFLQREAIMRVDSSTMGSAPHTSSFPKKMVACAPS